MPDKIVALNAQPGIQRDGTKFASRRWSDGLWCRFQRGLPRKIGGYKLISDTIQEIVYGMIVVNNTPNFNIFMGTESHLYAQQIDFFGNPLGAVSVIYTPFGFPTSPFNIWSFDYLYDDTSTSNSLIAHAAPNLSTIENDINRPVYFGPVNAGVPLIPAFTNVPPGQVAGDYYVSGGVVSLHPYLLIFGNNGFVAWSAANDPSTVLSSARITSSKIVAGFQVRAGNSSPGGLLWSLDSVIRVTLTTSPPVLFTFDTVTSESSVFAPKTIVEYDGIFYWISVDRFLQYTGVVQEIPNDTNLNFFFNNVDYAYSQKTWGTKSTQYGEIWWPFPTKDTASTPNPTHECNWAIVYNVREKTWYDTPLERSSGYFSEVFADPIWTGNAPNVDFGYDVWIHDIGVDENRNNVLTVIPSSITSPDITFCATGPDGNWSGIDKQVELYRLEPDFLLSGNMTLTVDGKNYAQSPVSSEPIYQATITPTTEKLDIRQQRRQMTLKFETPEFGTTTTGGDFQMGQNLLIFRLGDGHQ
jgi:hypothetical protein